MGIPSTCISTTEILLNDLWKACNYEDVISVLGELIVAGFCIYSLKYSK